MALTGSNSEIIHEPLHQDDPTQRRPVIDAARQALDWEATIQLDEGLARTTEYFSQFLREKTIWVS